VVSQLFVEIIKCELDFHMVAMGEPDPCREPVPRESRQLLECAEAPPERMWEPATQREAGDISQG